MTQAELYETYQALKTRRQNILDEIAALEIGLQDAGVLFAALGHLLLERQTGGLEWTRYQELTSELPQKAARYRELKIEIEDIQAQLTQFAEFG